MVLWLAGTLGIVILHFDITGAMHRNAASRRRNGFVNRPHSPSERLKKLTPPPLLMLGMRRLAPRSRIRTLNAGAAALSATAALVVAAGGALAFSSKVVNFTSPSGNIGCNIIVGLSEGGNGVRCDIKVHTFKIPHPHPACKLAFGDSLEVGTSGKAGPVCHGDTVFEPGEGKLAYGKSKTLDHFTCTSATSGMTCTNTKTRHGFFISKATYRLF